MQVPASPTHSFQDRDESFTNITEDTPEFKSPFGTKLENETHVAQVGPQSIVLLSSLLR